MVSPGVRTREGTTSFTIAQTLDSDRAPGAQQVSIQLHLTVEGTGRDARRAQSRLLNEFDRCASVGMVQRFIDEHRDMINYVNVNRRRMDADNALFSLEDYLEPGVPRGAYAAQVAQPREGAPAGTQQGTRPASYTPSRIPEAEYELRSPLEHMNREAERAQMPPEQRQPPPQLQVQEDVLLTAEEVAAVESLPEPAREEAAEQARRNIQVLNSAVPEEIALPIVRSSPHLTVSGWWDELNRSCGRSEALAGRLGETTSRYYEAVDALEAARGTPEERGLKGRVRELEVQMRALERELDPLFARQGSLMANILSLMPDAYGWAMEEPSRDRDEMLADLNAIRDEWASNQEKIRNALSLRLMTGAVSADLAPAFAAARRGSIENINDVFARMMQNNPEIARSFVDWAALQREAQIGPAVAPITAAREEAAEGSFTFRSRHGTFRITIAGEDLSGLTFNEVKKRMMELVNDQSISNRQILEMLTVEQLREGRGPYRYESRYLLRTEFFQNYASGAIRTLTPSLGVAGSVPVVERPAAIPREEERRVEEALRREGLAPAPAPAAVEIPSEYSISYDTVMGWNRRLSQLESENERLMQRAVASRDTGIEEDVERRFDANVEEQVRLMANISRSLEGAISAVSSGANRRRLESIREGWPAVQSRMLELVDVRGSLFTEHPTYPEPLRSRILYLCNTPIGAIRASMAGEAPAVSEVPAAAAPAVAEAERQAPVSAEGVRDSAWARDMHDSIIRRSLALRDFARERDAARADGREYGRQEEMDRFLAELVRDYVTFRNEITAIRADVEAEVGSTGLGIQVLDEMKRLEARTGSDGRRIAEITGMSARELVAFAETYLAGVSVEAAPAVEERPIVPAPPIVAERPVERRPEERPAAPPAEVERPAPAAPARRVERPAEGPAVSAAPVEAAPVEARPEELVQPPAERERMAEIVFNYLRMYLSEPEARRLSDYVLGRASRIGRLAFTSEENAVRTFETLNRYVERFGLGPVVVVEEEGRFVLTDAPRPPRTDNIIQDLARTNMNFTQDVANWAVGQYNEVYPDFPVAVEGWYSPAEIFRRGRMIEIVSSAVFRALRSMNESRYRVVRRGTEETVNGYDFGAHFVFEGLGRRSVELSESEAMVGQFSNQDIAILFAWIMSSFTGGHEHMAANIRHAADPRQATPDQRYSGNNIDRASLTYYNNNHGEFMAGLPRELQAAIDYNAFILAAMVRTYYVRAHGEPETGEAATQLDASCINAGRVIILGQMEAEMGRGWHRTFTYNGQEYMLGTHLLTRPSPESGIMIDGERRQHLLVLPTENPLEVMVVGYWDRGQAHLLREGGGNAVANVRLETTPEGMAYIPHHVSGRDSLGDGLTPMWCYPSPGYRFGESAMGMPDRYADIGAPPYAGLGGEYEDAVPPALASREMLLGRAVPQLGGVFEYYTRGESLDEAHYTISNPVLEQYEGGDWREVRAIPLEEMLDNRNTFVEMAMFRSPSRGEDRYYSTLTPQAQEAYSSILQNPDGIVHTAELSGGNIYVHVDMETHRIVDALDPSLRDAQGEIRRIFVGAYSIARNPEGIVTGYSVDTGPARAALRDVGIELPTPLDDGRGLVMARVPGREILEMANSGELEIRDNSLEIRMAVADQVRSMSGTNRALYPLSESYLAIGSVTAYPLYIPMGEAAITAGPYNYGMVAGRMGELEALHQEFNSLSASAKTTMSSEEEKRAEMRMAEIFIRRREIYDEILSMLDSAIPSYSGDARAALEGFRGRLMESRPPEIREMRDYIEYVRGESYFSHAYLLERWNSINELHARFEELSSAYYSATEDAEKNRLATEGWRLLLRRRDLYLEMMQHIDSSAVGSEGALLRVNAYRAEIERNFGEHFADMDFEALRAELGG